MDFPAPHRRLCDPRHYQIAMLSALLVYGKGALSFDISALQVTATLVTALATQAVFDVVSYSRVLPETGEASDDIPRKLGMRPALVAINFKSALISGLSLCLLLRTNDPEVAVAAVVVAIAGKFLIRVREKHLFNPTNAGLASMMLLTDRVWVSPGQWGEPALFAFLLACLGGLVVYRASRSDVTYAFLIFYVAIVVGRSLWLGEPLAIAWPRLQNGAFLLFTFFMISDPKTTPDSRAGRILFALLVALGAGYVQFFLFRQNGLIWSLAAAAPLVAVIDRLLPGAGYQWPQPVKARPSARLPTFDSSSSEPQPPRVLWGAPKGAFMKRLTTALAVAGLIGLTGPELAAFCGFYVSKADTKLFNQASQIVLVRDRDRTVITMANDYRGDPREFAMVVPVPTSVARDQINVADRALLDHLDAFTSPRLVEYFDENPCAVFGAPNEARSELEDAARRQVRERADALGVTIEAQYTVGEYDILILSAAESRGLETWLTANGYRIPDGAARILGSYIRQQMRFFVAKVNLEEQTRLGLAMLRPLQIAFESPKFMLPIRLGTVNADGPQELFVYTLTRTGRVETTNYRTVRLPSDLELPVFLKEDGEFARFYRALFDEQVVEADMRAVFLEYAWDMGWCDPCAADPLTADELARLGVFWVDDGSDRAGSKARAQDVFVTRLHVRYDAEHFPEDLVFQETADRTNFQGRYVLRHAWSGSEACAGTVPYLRELVNRHEREAQTLASVTGWDLTGIRRRMELDAVSAPDAAAEPWWRRLWYR